MGVMHIFERYQEEQRHYHTTQHIMEMLRLYDDHFARLTYLSKHQHTALYFAIWYHDAIYVPGKGDNEQRSSDLARRELTERGFDAIIIDAVARLVESTADHNPACMDERILSDLDLAILGAAPERYQEYKGQVREEYSFVEEAQFRAGRLQIISEFHARDPIFYYLTELEQQAKENLFLEIGTLA